MDLTYDRLQGGVFEDDKDKKETVGAAEGAAQTETETKGEAVPPRSEPETLNSELKQVYSLFSASPWGARIGSLMGTVKKQVHIGLSY
jgi:hypothetical protein